MKNIVKISSFFIALLFLTLPAADQTDSQKFLDVLSPEGFPLVITVQGQPYLIYQHRPIQQADLASCALHALKNSIHIDNLLSGRETYSSTQRLITAKPNIKEETGSQGTLYSPAPLSDWRKIINKLEGDIDKDKIVELLEKLKPDQPIGIFDQVRITQAEALTDDQIDFLINLQKALLRKTPSNHSFLLGDMKQVGLKYDPSQGHGHWFAFTIQIDRNGELSYHYCNSSSEYYDPSATIKGLEQILNTFDLATLKALQESRRLDALGQ